MRQLLVLAAGCVQLIGLSLCGASHDQLAQHVIVFMQHSQQ